MQLKVRSSQTAILPGQFARMDVFGLYVHIPFCFHKCHYCDFYSITGQSTDRMVEFVDRILGEADLWASSRVKVTPGTIFFGGGTPSLLPEAEMARLIGGLRERMDFTGLDEFTVEVNPATGSENYFAMLKECGVTRISMGGQSFDRAELKTLERHHEPADVITSVEQARRAGFERINVDLIYAIPGQSLAGWQRNLEAVIELETEHVSAYGLTYEPNTLMTRRKSLGEFVACEDSLELEMMRHARARLGEIGMPAYEISNYAKAGEECRHNLLYWNGDNYVSLGPSAASHIDGVRWKNSPNLGEWERRVDAGELAAIDVETLSAGQRMGEWVWLQSRLSRGVKFAEYRARMGSEAQLDYADVLGRLSVMGLIVIDGEGFRLSEAGIAVADAIGGEFLR